MNPPTSIEEMKKELSEILDAYEEPIFSWLADSYPALTPKYTQDRKESVKQFQSEMIVKIINLFESQLTKEREERRNKMDTKVKRWISRYYQAILK